MAKKALTRKQICAKLDRISKLYARYKDAFLIDGVPHTKCVTCGKVAVIDKNMHGGHFIKASVQTVRWDVNNIHSQCASDNTYRDGAEAEYSQYIIKRYGLSEFNRLVDTKKEWLSGRVKPPKIDELRSLLVKYESLMDSLSIKPPKK